MTELTSLTPGMVIPFDGNRCVTVDSELAASFEPGDRLYVVHSTGALRRVPREVHDTVAETVDRAVAAAEVMRTVPAERVQRFYSEFAGRLDAAWPEIAAANREDVVRAQKLGRSTTRLEVSERMRDDMIAGLRAWRDEIDPDAQLGVSTVATVDHGDWQVEERTAPLGVIGFVFEGRPNVFADSAGVLATGNAAVLRIGGDALATATAILEHALAPALAAAELPEGALTLVPSRERAAGWALFSDSRLSLAVVRGSGSAVTELSSIAQQAGIAVSAHGTGGAWMFADRDADAERFAQAVEHSLDRKVCNTLNTLVIVKERAAELIPLACAAADRAATKRAADRAAADTYPVAARLHVVAGTEQYFDDAEFTREIVVVRAEGTQREHRASHLPEERLGHEWEWEGTPELTVVVVDDLEGGIALFNRYSPQFVATLLSENQDTQRSFQARVNAPFVGDGFTRWVDGQYALNQTELGLSNWERGRLLARSGVLTGADLTARRLFARHRNPGQHR